MKYNKLVRDKIPKIIEADNKPPITHIADDVEYRQKLNEKLLEEVNEYLKDEDPKEIADVYEVIDGIIELNGFSKEKILAIQAKKRHNRGAFKKRIILDETQ